MAKVRLEGFKENAGVIEKTGMPYHSVKFHFSGKLVGDKAYGREVFDSSVKFENLPSVLGSAMTFDELACYLFDNCKQEIDVFFDRNKKVETIILPDLDKAKKPA